jgi:hypothetical protein
MQVFENYISLQLRIEVSRLVSVEGIQGFKLVPNFIALKL